MTPQEFDKRVVKAKSLLIMSHPFYGSAVSKRKITYSDSVPTAAMSAKGAITINPEWASDLSVKQLQFLLAHEAMHYLLGHAHRIGSRNHKRWNIACDKVINDLLIEGKVGEFIDGGVHEEGARAFSADELYGSTEESEGDDGYGIGDDIGSPADDDGRPMEQAEVSAMEAMAKIELLQAAKTAKQAGRLQAGLDRIIEEMLTVHTPWHEILERYMQARIRDNYSWSRPNRRFISQGMYLPGIDYSPKCGEVVIAVDTSGSLGSREIAEFNAHINRVLEVAVPDKLHVLYCDTSVNDHIEITPDEFPVQLAMKGGGGTRFGPVFDWVADNDIEPEVLIYLTDGYGDQQTLDQPPYDVVWLTTGFAEFPFGSVIEYKVGE